MTPIIRPGNSELLAEVMGGGFPSMFQAFISVGPRMMATPLLVRPMWHVLFVMRRRCPQIVVEN